MSAKPAYLVMALTIALWFPAAQSAEKQALSGAGTASCGEYLEHTANKQMSNAFLSWAQGFLSGMNMADVIGGKKNFALLPDAPTIKAYLDKYCRDNPLNSPVEGSLSLYKELRSKL